MRFIRESINRKKIAYPDHLDEYITEDNPVRVMNAFVDSSDMIKLGFEKAFSATTGRLRYNPKEKYEKYQQALKDKDGEQDFLDTVDKRTPENKELYKKRQMIVERPFRTVKRV